MESEPSIGRDRDACWDFNSRTSFRRLVTSSWRSSIKEIRPVVTVSLVGVLSPNDVEALIVDVDVDVNVRR